MIVPENVLMGQGDLAQLFTSVWISIGIKILSIYLILQS